MSAPTLSAEQLAARLEAAAARLVELAEPMDRRPLQILDEPDGTGGGFWQVYCPDPDTEELYCFLNRADAEWFRAMSPIVAAPLAAILRDAAQTSRNIDADGDRSEEESASLAMDLFHDLVTFANHLLGGTP